MSETTTTPFRDLIGFRDREAALLYAALTGWILAVELLALLIVAGPPAISAGVSMAFIAGNALVGVALQLGVNRWTAGRA